MDTEKLQELDSELAKEEATLLKQLKDVAVENPVVQGDFEPVMKDYGDTEEDRITEATELDRDVAMEQQLERRLKEVRAAREQIAQGKYGNCTNCASPISSDRLNVMPTATLCISCAQKAL